MALKIALVGNPNSGKTTLFNQLTGNRQYVGNWSGVAVERKTGKLKNHGGVEVVDLPGISLIRTVPPDAERRGEEGDCGTGG